MEKLWDSDFAISDKDLSTSRTETTLVPAFLVSILVHIYLNLSQLSLLQINKIFYYLGQSKWISSYRPQLRPSIEAVKGVVGLNQAMEEGHVN